MPRGAEKRGTFLHPLSRLDVLCMHSVLLPPISVFLLIHCACTAVGIKVVADWMTLYCDRGEKRGVFGRRIGGESDR